MERRWWRALGAALAIPSILLVLWATSEISRPVPVTTEPQQGSKTTRLSYRSSALPDFPQTAPSREALEDLQAKVTRDRANLAALQQLELAGIPKMEQCLGASNDPREPRPIILTLEREETDRGAAAGAPVVPGPPISSSPTVPGDPAAGTPAVPGSPTSRGGPPAREATAEGQVRYVVTRAEAPTYMGQALDPDSRAARCLQELERLPLALDARNAPDREEIQQVITLFLPTPRTR